MSWIIGVKKRGREAREKYDKNRREAGGGWGAKEIEHGRRDRKHGRQTLLTQQELSQSRGWHLIRRSFGKYEARERRCAVNMGERSVGGQRATAGGAVGKNDGCADDEGEECPRCESRAR